MKNTYLDLNGLLSIKLCKAERTGIMYFLCQVICSSVLHLLVLFSIFVYFSLFVTLNFNQTHIHINIIVMYQNGIRSCLFAKLQSKPTQGHKRKFCFYSFGASQFQVTVCVCVCMCLSGIFSTFIVVSIIFCLMSLIV